MKHVVVATVLVLCAGSSFSKEASPACAALQNAKESSASGQKFEPYRLVTDQGEQLITTAEQAIELWTPVCQRQRPSGGKVGASSKTVAPKSDQG